VSSSPSSAFDNDSACRAQLIEVGAVVVWDGLVSPHEVEDQVVMRGKGYRLLFVQPGKVFHEARVLHFLVEPKEDAMLVGARAPDHGMAV
jgi:hypothetical protein